MAWHKTHPACEGFDRVEIECVERWKESHMSGDEWRFAYRVRAYFKGAVVLEYARSRLQEAASHLPFELDQMRDDKMAQLWGSRRDACCDQPGCSKEPTKWFRLKEQFSALGEGPLPDHGLEHYRKFCSRHSHRGDCSREDADDNYVEISKPKEGT